jgi:clan AA aspartic protease (TIGR02281 family)
MMFRTNVVLNDRLLVRALIDTGASYLSLCAPLAKGLGLKLGRRLELTTANGTIQARYATVESIRMARIEIRAVTAVVISESTPCPEPIVGMSVLHKLESMTLTHGSLVLIGPASSKPAAENSLLERWWSWWNE